MRRMTFGERMDWAHRFVIGCGLFLLFGFGLIGIGTGVVEGIHGATPVLAGIGCIALSFVAFFIAMKLEFPTTHGRQR